MANIVYANPFGSYVSGQEAGQKQAIDLGTAERQFRESDLNNEYQKWYLPHKQQEVEIKQKQEELATNKAQMQYLALIAASGNKDALQALQNHIKAVSNIDVNLTQLDGQGRPDPVASAMLAQIVAGNIPSAFLDRSVYMAGGIGRMNFPMGGAASPVAPRNMPYHPDNNVWDTDGQQQQNGGTTQVPNAPAALPYLPQPLGMGQGQLPTLPTMTQPQPTVPPVTTPMEPGQSEFTTYGTPIPKQTDGATVSALPDQPHAPIMSLPAAKTVAPVNVPTTTASIWHDERPPTSNSRHAQMAAQ